MVIFTIEQWATKECCDLEGYSQKIISLLSDEIVGCWYSKSSHHDYFPVFVRSEQVEASDGSHAIAKFLEWERKGYPKNWLLETNCNWNQDEFNCYETSCGEAFELNHGNCEENKFRYCPFCGKVIAEEKYVPEPEEEPVYLRSMVMGEQ